MYHSLYFHPARPYTYFGMPGEAEGSRGRGGERWRRSYLPSYVRAVEYLLYPTLQEGATAKSKPGPGPVDG